jgi:hypothetical protein
MKTKTQTIKSTIAKLKKEYPGVDKIAVSYNGSGDSFDSFSSVSLSKNSKPVKRQAQNNFTQKYDDILSAALEISDADFNNEGSEGEVVFDLKKNKIFVENYLIIHERKHSGTFTLSDENLNLNQSF